MWKRFFVADLVIRKIPGRANRESFASIPNARFRIGEYRGLGDCICLSAEKVLGGVNRILQVGIAAIFSRPPRKASVRKKDNIPLAKDIK